jgi:predicted PhzF superfamily epimerase YddE/YHI9
MTKLTENGLGHLMITSKSNSKQADFVVRYFAPIAGINEDPEDRINTLCTYSVMG